MKAISLWEPWASLVRTGAKKWETRHWKTNYRGKLLICAAQGGVSKLSLKALLARRDFQVGLAPLITEKRDITSNDLNFGMAVATVDLVDCRKTDHLTVGELGPDELNFGDFQKGRYAWKFENLKAIEPFPVKGSQGFFNVQAISFDSLLNFE